jgi:hypothetical protein
LTAQQKQALIVDVKSADFWRMKAALEKLAAKDPKAPDADLGALIYPLTSHEGPFIRTAAFGAIKKWAPDLHDKAALNYRYRMSTEAVEPPDRPVTKDTPLPVGLIVCARSQCGWRGAEVREVLSNGKVKVKYGGNSPPWDLEVARADLQLAPDEVDQPNLDEKALTLVRGTGGASAAGASAFRTWTDNTGTFRLEAEVRGVADGKVKLLIRDLNAADTRTATWEAPIFCAQTLGTDAPVAHWYLAEYFLTKWTAWQALLSRYLQVFRTRPRGCAEPMA